MGGGPASIVARLTIWIIAHIGAKFGKGKAALNLVSALCNIQYFHMKKSPLSEYNRKMGHNVLPIRKLLLL